MVLFSGSRTKRKPLTTLIFLPEAFFKSFNMPLKLTLTAARHQTASASTAPPATILYLLNVYLTVQCCIFDSSGGTHTTERQVVTEEKN